MYCSKCGKESSDTTSFCTDRGKKLRKNKKLYEDICEGIQLRPKKFFCFLNVLRVIYLEILAFFLLFCFESNVGNIQTTPINIFVFLFLIRFSCWIAILGGIWAFVKIIKLIIKNKPIIIVNQNGISTFFSKKPYFISWDNIENIGIHITYTRGHLFKIKNIQICLKQPLNKHSCAYISLETTGIKYEDFLQQVLEYKELIGK